jgi:hypothetical protein
MAGHFGGNLGRPISTQLAVQNWDVVCEVLARRTGARSEQNAENMTT